MTRTTRAAGLRFLLMIAALISAATAIWAFSRPLVGLHNFRQTQTAISTYWMLHGAGWWDYETPVLGAPWHDPFEFPLFQWIVASVVSLTGIALDAAGQMVSYAWLLLMVWPVRALVRSYALPETSTLIFAALLLLSPVYLYWGHAFLIETQAVTLGFAMLALARTFFIRRAVTFALLAALAGTASALTKITTVGPFLFLLLLMLIEAVWTDRGQPRRQAVALAGAALIALPGPLLFSLWTMHADALKAATPYTARHMSTTPAMKTWNFGTTAQRVSLPFAQTVLRALVDIGGWLGPVLLVALPVLWRTSGVPDRRTGAILAGLTTAWFLPFAVFTNLHIIHDYYQAGNAALLILALAIMCAKLGEGLRNPLHMALLAVIMASQYLRTVTHFAHGMSTETGEREHAVGLYVRSVTPTGSAVAGMGFDWSSGMPYYAERKAMLIQKDADQARAQVAGLPGSLGGLPLAAVAICPSPAVADPIVQAGLTRLTRGMRRREIEGCTVYSADRS